MSSAKTPFVPVHTNSATGAVGSVVVGAAVGSGVPATSPTVGDEEHRGWDVMLRTEVVTNNDEIYLRMNVDCDDIPRSGR